MISGFTLQSVLSSDRKKPVEEIRRLPRGKSRCSRFGGSSEDLPARDLHFISHA
jgi:hypothetical protein